MTNDQLEVEIKRLIIAERKITNEILMLINLAESRKLHLERGYSSLFDWLTAGLGYSESSAYRRIEAARAMVNVPGIKDKLESGELTLTNVAKARSAIRAQEKASSIKLNVEEQTKIFAAVENRTGDEATAELFKLLPDTVQAARQERTVRIDEETVRVTINLDKVDLENLARVKDLLSHALPNASTGQVIARALAELARKKRKLTSAAEVETCCSYEDESTGKICGSTYQVQMDHIVPKALGGTDEPRNMRPLCRAHNLFMAERWLGAKWANCWRRFDNAREMVERHMADVPIPA